MPHVFISHAEEDLYFAFWLRDQLRNQFEVWLDATNLSPGCEWKDYIDSAIQDAFAVVVVVSPESARSEYVIYEWSYALGCGKKIFPVKLREVVSPHPLLQRRQILPFTIRNPEYAPIRDLQKSLTKELDEYIAHDAAQAIASVPDYAKFLCSQLASALDDELLKTFVANLGGLGYEFTLPYLEKYLQHDDPTVISITLTAIGQIVSAAKVTLSEAQIEEVGRHMYHQVYNVRRAAKNALSDFGDQAVPFCTELLKDCDHVVDDLNVGKINALLVLESLAGSEKWLEDIYDAVLRATSDGDPSVRGQALLLLSQYRAPDVLPALRGAFDDWNVTWTGRTIDGDIITTPISSLVYRCLLQIHSEEAQALAKEWERLYSLEN